MQQMLLIAHSLCSIHLIISLCLMAAVRSVMHLYCLCTEELLQVYFTSVQPKMTS